MEEDGGETEEGEGRKQRRGRKEARERGRGVCPRVRDVTKA